MDWQQILILYGPQILGNPVLRQLVQAATPAYQTINQVAALKPMAANVLANFVAKGLEVVVSRAKESILGPAERRALKSIISDASYAAVLQVTGGKDELVAEACEFLKQLTESTAQLDQLMALALRPRLTEVSEIEWNALAAAVQSCGKTSTQLQQRVPAMLAAFVAALQLGIYKETQRAGSPLANWVVAEGARAQALWLEDQITRAANDVREVFQAKSEQILHAVDEVKNLMVDQWVAPVGRESYNRRSMNKLFSLYPELTRGTAGQGFGELNTFLQHYLGAEDLPAPFGGRTKEIEALDTWLESAQGAFMLVTAKGGRGKSALLAQWSRRIAQSHRADVAFVPISRRHHTASESPALDLLGLRLAYLTSSRITGSQRGRGWIPFITDTICQRPANGRTLLIVIDGADETDGWEIGKDLIFGTPAPGVKVLISARVSTDEVVADGWRERLHILQGQRLQLYPLSEAGLAEAVVSLGPAGAMAKDKGLIKRLHELTQGDPLVTRFYLEELKNPGQPGWTLASFRARESGLKGYFLNWWREHADLDWDKELTALAYALAAARGPVSLNDLMFVGAERGLDKPEQLKRALKAMSHFVPRDQIDEHYVLAHPSVNEYFQFEMGEAEFHYWEGRFLAYGRQALKALTSGGQPVQVPLYVLRHYADHIINAGADDEQLYALACSTWQRAWALRLPASGGFEAELKRIAERAAHRGHLAMQVRCILINAALSKQNHAIPPKLLRRCYETGLLSEAELIATILNSPLLHASDELGQIYPQLQPHFQRELFSAVINSNVPLVRLGGAKALLPHLLAEDVATAEAVYISALAALAEERGEIGPILESLVWSLPPRLIAGVLEIIKALPHTWSRLDALAYMAPVVTKQTLTAAVSANWPAVDHARAYQEAAVLSRLIPAVHDRLAAILNQRLETACDNVLETGEDLYMVDRWFTVLPATARRRMASQLIGRLGEFNPKDPRTVLEYLPDELLPAALHSILGAQSVIMSVKWLPEILGRLSWPAAAVLSCLPPDPRPGVKEATIAVLLTVVSADEQPELLGQLGEPRESSVMAFLAQYGPNQLRPQMLDRWAHNGNWYRDDMETLAEKLSKQQVQVILERAASSEFDDRWTLAPMLDYIPDDLLVSALRAFPQSVNPSQWAFALRPLFAPLPWRRARMAARRFRDAVLAAPPDLLKMHVLKLLPWLGLPSAVVALALLDERIPYFNRTVRRWWNWLRCPTNAAVETYRELMGRKGSGAAEHIDFLRRTTPRFIRARVFTPLCIELRRSKRPLPLLAAMVAFAPTVRLRAQMITEVLANLPPARDWDDEVVPQILTRLSHWLPDTDVARITAQIYSDSSPDSKPVLLAALAQRLRAYEVDDVIAMVRDLSDTETRLTVLVQLSRAPGANLLVVGEALTNAFASLPPASRALALPSSMKDYPVDLMIPMLDFVVDAIGESFFLPHTIEVFTAAFKAEVKRNPAHAAQLWNAVADGLREVGGELASLSLAQWIEWPLALSYNALTAEALLDAMIDVAQTWKL